MEKAKAARYFRILGEATVDGDGAAGPFSKRGGPEPATTRGGFALSQADVSEKVARLDHKLDSEASRRPQDFETLIVTRRAIVRDAQEGLQKLRLEGPSAELTDGQVLGLEAIVVSDGSRPSIRFVDDRLVPDDDVERGPWKTVIDRHRLKIEACARSTGRIDLDGVHWGTGFSIGDGLILTNRHVLQQIAVADEAGGWRFRGNVTIDFGSGDTPSPARRFACLEDGIVTADQEIDPLHVDFAKHDYAAIRCAVPAGASFPPPLRSETDESHIAMSRNVYAIGFPGQPAPGAYPFAVLSRLFGYTFGVKRFAPGKIAAVLGSLAGDTNRTVLQYDATTLPGSSGSAVIDVDENGVTVPGLHFGGWDQGNYAHGLSASRLRRDMERRGIELPSV